MKVSVSSHLKEAIKREITGNSQHDNKSIICAIAGQIFPEMKGVSLLIGDKIELIAIENN